MCLEYGACALQVRHIHCACTQARRPFRSATFQIPSTRPYGAAPPQLEYHFRYLLGDLVRVAERSEVSDVLLQAHDRAGGAEADDILAELRRGRDRGLNA